jgi:DNA modification methylase
MQLIKLNSQRKAVSMKGSKLLFQALNLNDNSALQKFSRLVGIPVGRLKYYNKTNTFPSGNDLDHICSKANITPMELMLKMGIPNRRIKNAIHKNADRIFELIKSNIEFNKADIPLPPSMYKSKLGKLYQGNCLNLMHNLENDSIDLIFADPPFNLKKLYPSKIDDNLKEYQYLNWCEEWAAECIRILKPGGSFFLWNLPKWNTYMSDFLNNYMTFRHWISVDMKYSLPIQGRLYPSHYSLLYYCKGEKPSKFHPDRFPMPICPHCAGDLKDYGGYKAKMNPEGVNMTDVWLDIPPVRHAKYKKRNGANELSIRLLDRIIELASDEGDIVFDPFGGSGTTYAVAEIKKRKWIGVELGPVDEIISRMKNIKEEAEFLKDIRKNYNCLFTDETLKLREQKGLWTCESVRKIKINRDLCSVTN